MGSRVKEINKLTKTEIATVKANGLNHSPETPCMNATGINTAIIEKVVEATAKPISRVPSDAAVRRSLPISICRTMFSRTTMASSINTPMASDKPSKVIKLRVKPHSQTAIKAAITEVGKLSAVINVERHEFKKTNTTNTVKIAPNNSESITLFKLFCAFLPPSQVISTCVPWGSVALISATTERTLSATVIVLALLDRTIYILTFGCILRML